MDAPVVYLGKSHRVLFHDYVSAYAIAKDSYPDDPNAVLAAFYHILLDQLCSENPEYKKYLESLEILNKAKRKRKTTKTKQRSKIEDRFLKDLKKLAELRRLLKYYYSSS